MAFTHDLLLLSPAGSFKENSSQLAASPYRIYTSLTFIPKLWVIILGCFLLVVVVIAHTISRRQLNIPKGVKVLPGPRGLPIIGCVPQLPSQHVWCQFHEWAKTYGPIYQVNLAGTNCVFISSPSIAEDVFVKRAAIYSDRPFIPAFKHDVTAHLLYVPLMSIGEDHKRGKTFMKSLLSSMPKDNLKATCRSAAKQLITKLLNEPSKFQSSLEACTSGISAQMAWNDKDPAVAQETLWVTNKLLCRISPDGAILNKLSFLRSIPEWVPDILQPWKVLENARCVRERTFWEGQREKVRTEMKKGPTERSWTNTFFTSKGTLPGITDDTEAAYAVGMMAVIGSVLVSSPLQSFFLAMCHYPDWQVKAQAEIDSVCGNRLPTHSDIQKLPIVRAIIRETLRWRSPVPVGVPHALREDDIYNGHFIPKDSVVFALEWTMNMDETRYPDAQTFRPDRWLDPAFPTYKEPLTHHPNITAHSGFGWGRRTCIGQEYTEVVHLTIISAILWSCTITKKKDPKSGLDIKVPWYDFGPYAIVRPNPWELDIKPRDGQRIEILGMEE
ncbi:hypothetical protein MMC27_006358 [Xylographa pallens]|nr:hypothetical protein [Xylographa pallens]